MADPLPSSRALFDEHGAYVYRVLRYLQAPARDLEDLAQETFLVAHRSRAQFRGEGSPKSWLAGIAKNVLRDSRRRTQRRREEPFEMAEDPRSGPSSPEETVGFRQSLSRLTALLDGLSEDQRLVFILYEVEQLSMKEITDMLGCPLQTGYTRLRAARDVVARAFAEGARVKEGP